MGALFMGPRASAQGALSAPTVTTLTAGAGSLTVEWTAPGNTGGSTIKAYDLRYIRSDAGDKADDNWTVREAIWSWGTLEYTESGLLDGLGYDVQVRAVNATGEGPWSATLAGAAADYGNDMASATALAVGGTLRGRVDPRTDDDYFTFELASTKDVWIYTTGDLDTAGELFNSSGSKINANDNVRLITNPHNFGILHRLNRGTYYARVSSGGSGGTGEYALHIETPARPGRSLETAAPIQVNSAAPGWLLSDDDEDWFRLDLTGDTRIWVSETSSQIIKGELLDSDGQTIVSNDNSYLEGDEGGFVLWEDLDAGTYYIRVRGNVPAVRTSFFLNVRVAPEPGASTETAEPLQFETWAPGRISSPIDRDYFRFTLEEETFFSIRAQEFPGSPMRNFPLWGRVYNEEGTLIDDTILYYGPGLSSSPIGFGFPIQYSFRADVRLGPGTYYLRVWRRSGQLGTYAVKLVPDHEYPRELKRCLALTTPKSDPLYGCQWHLGNTKQFPGSVGEDINVESVWAGGNTGSGVNVAIVDNGLFLTHEDLVANMVASRNHNYAGGSFPAAQHGTHVAGLIAAEQNDIGVRGVAPDANFYLYNLLSGGFSYDTSARAMVRNLTDTAVSNNSWGPPDRRGRPYLPGTAWELAIEQGITEGFGGKGIVYVWSSGNGRPYDNSNLDGYANFYGVMAVGAITENDRRAGYADIGANVWVVAPSGDLYGTGFTGITTTAAGGRYRTDFLGTSASAPIASGVVALIRAANPTLTWRDVKLVVAGSARKNYPEAVTWERGAPKYLSATERSSERYWFSPDFGFGAIDAQAAVTLAGTWTNLPPMRTMEVRSGTLDLAIRDTKKTGTNGPPTRSDLTIDANYIQFIEYIAIEVELTHPSLRDLRMQLVAPSQDRSLLVDYLYDSRSSPVSFRGWHRFGSAMFLGEAAGGDWRLVLSDYVKGDTGTLKQWKITVYGHGYTSGYPAISSVAQGDGTVTIGWDAPSEIGGSAITSYEVRSIRSDAADKADGNWTVVTGIATTAPLSSAVTGLTDGVQYDFQVRAVNSAGAGPWSEPVSATATAAVAPAAPAIASIAPRDGELVVTWSAPAGDGDEISRYDLRYIRSDAMDKGDGNWTVSERIWGWRGGSLRHTVSGPDNDVMYDVQVRAGNSAGTGSWSATTTATPAITNTPPAFSTNDTVQLDVSEDLEVGGNVGEPQTATDTEGDSLKYELSERSDLFRVDTSTGQLRTRTRLDYESGSTYSLTLRVRDEKDSNGDRDQVDDDDTLELTVTVGDVDEGPDLSGPREIVYVEKTTGSVGTYTATDPEGTITSFTWTLGDRDSADFEISNGGVLTFKGAPKHEDPDDSNRNNLYEVRVQASDGTFTGTRGVEVIVTNVNDAPTVTGRTSTNYPENGDAPVATYSASDPDDAPRFIWSLSGADAEDFAISEEGVLTFRSNPDYEIPRDTGRDRTHDLTINVSDGFLTGSLDVTVTVTNVDEPLVIRGDDRLTYPEDRSGSVASYTAIDPEGETDIDWSLSGTDAADFAIIASGVLTFQEAPDYEHPRDSGQDNIYDFLIEATLGTDKSARAVTVMVTNVEESPAFPDDLDTDLSVDEDVNVGVNVGVALEASDGDNDALTYSLVSHSDVFEITTGGQLRTRAALDHETTSVHLLVVGVTDGKDASGNADNANDDSVTVTVTVDDVNETPSLTGQTSITLPEGGVTFVGNYLANDQDSGDSIGWSLAGTDAGDFAIENGILSFGENPDFESPADSGRNNIYNIVVRVSDGKNRDGQTDTRIDATLAVTVTVSNEEEAGTLTLTSNQPQVDTALTATLTDPDGGITALNWQWQVNDNGAWSNIAGATSARYTPVAADEGKRLRVTASYRDGHGSGKTATAELPNAVQTAPAANTPPEFATTSTSRSVDENTPANRDIGVPVAAADNEPLTYTLTGTDASSFTINSSTGQLRTHAALDYERKSSYAVVVTATDSSGAVDTISVTINVTDLNERPSFPANLRNSTLNVDENTPAGRSIGLRLTATDEDRGDSLTYTLDSASDLVFDITADTGQLSTEGPLDHETGPSYRVDVRVSDGKGADGTANDAIDDTITLTIEVNDRNEAPTVTGETSISYAEDRTDRVASYDHNDPDPGDTITWSLSGTDRDDFTISTAGELSFANQPDHDDPADGNRDNEYLVTIVASDGKLTATLAVRVTVGNMEEQPAFPANLDTSLSVAEDAGVGENVGAAIAATDGDNDPLTYSLVTPSSVFEIVAESGQLRTTAALDHETMPVHVLTVGVTDRKDSSGNTDDVIDATVVVTITVDDVNERPTLTGDFEVSVPEHGDLLVTRYSADDPERARLSWLLSGAADDDFELNNDGDLRFRAEPDFERPADSNGDNIYRLGVWVSDGHNTPSREVFVTVTNVDEPGSISLTSIQPQVGTPLTAALTDPDGGITGQSWQWQSSTDRSAWSDIASATASRYTPTAAEQGSYLRVTAAYDDKQGVGKTAETVLGVVRAAPASNTPPAFPTSETGRRTVSEDADPGQPIGNPFGAVDDDPGDTTVLTYSLDVASDTVFDINPERGQLLTEARLDREKRASYTIIVTAADPSAAVASIPVTITVEDVDEPPTLSGEPVISLPEKSQRPVATYTATDPEERDLSWRLDGRDRGAFELVDGVLSFLVAPDFESPANVEGVNTYQVTIVVSDGVHSPTLDVVVTVTDVDESATGPSPVLRGPIIFGPFIGGGGGGGGPSGPTPSDVDFEWTVKHDIEELDPGNDWPTGLWSDGRVLWIAENGDGADDAVYAYDLATGERLEQREFELAETNRAPRGFWSDGETVWVSDSGQDRLFAYDLESGERLEGREFELAERNRDARAIWSGGAVMWVLDGRRDALFGYDLASGELLAEYELAAANSDPRGLWSDGVSVWVSDHGAKRLFAYRLPVLDGDAVEDEHAQALERVRDEEFKELSKASNNSPRGLWSDGAVMYVADESDDKVYSYNMPDALDARLASLTLSDVEIGAFSPARTEYESTVTAGVTVTTVGAEAAQRGATVAIDPADADEDAEGHQLAITDGAEIMVTVTSSDGSRRKVYRVMLGEAGPSASCLRGAVIAGFSLVTYEGGSVEELETCAQSRNVTALYAIEAGEYVSYVTGAPDLVNARFRGLFAGGVPALTPLLTRSAGPASAAPDAPAVTDPLPACLVGEIAEGFNLALYEGGSVDDLAACVQSHNVTAVYTLHEGEYVSYILGAPELVNRSFRELFADGLAPATPLVAKRD